PLPHGMVIHDVKVIVQDIAAGGDVVDVGTKQKGTGTYADDTDEFHDAIPISARASFSSLDRGFHEPKVIEASKVYLTVTAPAGNAIAAPFALGIYIDYQFQGTP
ncbi:MAG: hypothetical protein OXC08_16355, partial [Thiotrichales bacterium]|nr:hypothetical protein [Thiotrichales bacterium]